MCFSTYYPNTAGRVSYAPCVQLVAPYQPALPQALIPATFIPPPTMSTHLHLHGFPNGIYCPQRDNPPTGIPPQCRLPRTPDRVARHEDASIPPVVPPIVPPVVVVPPVVPRAPAPPNPYRHQPLPDRAPPVADQPDPYRPQPTPDRGPPVADHGVHTTSRTAIDPILALPDPPSGRPRFEWDLADNPMRLLLRVDGCRDSDNRRVHDIHGSDLVRAAVTVTVRDGTRAPLERLVLVLAGAEIEVTHRHPATLLGAVDEDVPWVTVYDVFFELFQWLTSPIGGAERESLEDERYYAVNRAARARQRRRGRDGREAAGTGVGRAPYLKIDYLGERRRFKGIRLARGDEVPDGGRLGEVFVVELEAIE